MMDTNQSTLNPLDLKDKMEFLFKAISRYDFYINATNAKASLILGWNGIVIGTVLLKFDTILSLFIKPYWAFITSTAILLALTFCCVFSILLAFRVINPFLASAASSGKKSLLFFGSVAQMSFDTYSQAIKALSFEMLLSDLTQQAQVLANGLKKKMEDTRKSVRAIYGTLIFLIILFLLKGVIIYVAA